MQSATNPTPTPTPTATAQPEQVIAKPNTPPFSADGAVPAPVSTQTGAGVIAASQQQSIAHNSLVNANMGRTAGGKKRSKRSKRSKKAKKAKRSKKAKKSRQSRQSRRCRRGGATNLTPTPTPTNTTTTPKLATVPQFLGAQHAGANQASINLNHGGMLMSSQAAFDNPNAPASNHRLP
jgi:hypothetical protein